MDYKIRIASQGCCINALILFLESSFETSPLLPVTRPDDHFDENAVPLSEAETGKIGVCYFVFAV